MSISVKHLNADSTFLLTFSPPWAGRNAQGNAPGSFTVLVDPWLCGSSIMFNKRFAHINRTVPACIKSLRDLPDPDLVIISQDKPDHCHEETLRQLPADTNALLVGPAAVGKRVRSWKHFDPGSVVPLRRYDERQPDTVLRIPIPSISGAYLAGEVTVALLAPKVDMTGLHNAIAITYRPPASVLTKNYGSFVTLPPTPPASPPSNASPGSSVGQLATASSLLSEKGYEKTVSVLYSPHGVGYRWIEPYVSNHLLPQGSLPLDILFHSLNREQNPWFLGGNLVAGGPGGLEIAQRLSPRLWISAHDEVKDHGGVASMQLKTTKFGLEEVQKALSSGVDFAGSEGSAREPTVLLDMDAGEEYSLAQR